MPRSKGGFTYGRIVKDCAFPCRLDESCKHDVPGYRVLVSGATDDAPKVRKDVLAGNIGKLFIPEQMQAAMQAATEAATLPMPNVSYPYFKYNIFDIQWTKRRVSPEARESPSAAPAMPFTNAPVGPAPTSPVRGAAIGPLPTTTDADQVPEVGRVSPIPKDPLDIKGEVADQGEQGQKPLRGVIELPEGVNLPKPQKGMYLPIKYSCSQKF